MATKKQTKQTFVGWEKINKNSYFLEINRIYPSGRFVQKNYSRYGCCHTHRANCKKMGWHSAEYFAKSSSFKKMKKFTTNSKIKEMCLTLNDFAPKGAKLTKKPDYTF